MVMNIHIYGTFEKESQWRGASDRSGHIYIIYIHIHIHKTYLDAEFDVESFRMVYLASKGRLGKVICEKHTFLNNLWPPTVRVSHERWQSDRRDQPRCRPSDLEVCMGGGKHRSALYTRLYCRGQ